MMEVSGSSTKHRVDLTVMHFLWDVIHSTKFQAPDRLRKGFPTSKYGTKSGSLSQLYERKTYWPPYKILVLVALASSKGSGQSAPLCT